jgi:hypothetical protein
MESSKFKTLGTTYYPTGYLVSSSISPSVRCYAGPFIFPVNTIVEIEYGRTDFYIIEKKTGKKIDKADPGMAQYNPNATRGYTDVPDASY